MYRDQTIATAERKVEAAYRQFKAAEKELNDLKTGEKCYACGRGKQYVANDGTRFHVCPGGAGDPV